MLQVSQRLLDMRSMMVVNDRDRSGHLAVSYFLLVPDEMVANHVADGQRAISIPLFLNHPVELVEQRSAQRNTETRDLVLGHRASIIRRLTRQSIHRLAPALARRPIRKRVKIPAFL